MRIHIKTSANTQPIKFDYLQKLVGTIHKWIGPNDIHDSMSLYSFSWLMGAELTNGFLEFINGASFFLSFYDENIMEDLVRSVLKDPVMFNGMEVTDIQLGRLPNLSDRELFYCASPILIKRHLADNTIRHFRYDDPQASQYLKETLVRKMQKVGLEYDETLDIHFDLSYPNKKQKLVKYRGVGNKANMCPVIIKGKPETKLFAWTVGIGNSTGIGFGAIY